MINRNIHDNLRKPSVSESVSTERPTFSDRVSYGRSVSSGVSYGLPTSIGYSKPIGTSYSQPIGTSRGFSSNGVPIGHSVSYSGVSIGRSVSYSGVPIGCSMPIIRLRGYRFFPKNWSYKKYGYREGMMIVDDDSMIKCSSDAYFLGYCISFYQDIFKCFENMEEDAILAEVESCGFAVNVDGMVYTNRLLIIKEISLADFWNLEHE